MPSHCSGGALSLACSQPRTDALPDVPGSSRGSEKSSHRRGFAIPPRSTAGSLVPKVDSNASFTGSRLQTALSLPALEGLPEYPTWCSSMVPKRETHIDKEMYMSRPIYSFNGFEQKPVSHEFRPVDYSNAKAASSFATGFLGKDQTEKKLYTTLSMIANKTDIDKSLMFASESRIAMNQKDLSETRQPLVGYSVVAGYPGARLIGGSWRFCPKKDEVPSRGTVWTEYRGPVGGSRISNSYYGKAYDREGHFSAKIY